jgi:hypothetical protein
MEPEDPGISTRGAFAASRSSTARKGKCKEGVFQVKTTIGSLNPKTRRLLEETQKDAKEPD